MQRARSAIKSQSSTARAFVLQIGAAPRSARRRTTKYGEDAPEAISRFGAKSLLAKTGFARLGQKTVREQCGFTVVEVLLAATVFAFIVTALAGAIIYGRSGTATAGDRLQAVVLAEEGLEAVRNIRDAGYSNLADGTYGLAKSGIPLVWNFSGSSDTTGIFTRQITIANVDDDRKTVTSTVSWTTAGVIRSVTATMRLTDWQAALGPPPVPGPIIVAYTKGSNAPYYRIWNGSDWGNEGSAQSVGGTINYVVLKVSAARDEAVLGTQDSNGAIYFQVWNGSSWGNLTQVGSGPTTTRSFDIAYERGSGRAMIAYSSGADFAYRVWDGSALSSPTTVTAPPTTGQINWIETRQNPASSSDEISMIMSDANNDIYGMRWTGSAWDNMGAGTVWDSTASTGTKKGIDVEYEQNSGRALFMWGDATSTDQYYRIWNGTTLSSATLLDIAAAGGASEWVQLAARPNSNEILLGVQDAGGDLNTRKWSGSAWDGAAQHPEHDATVENIASRNFDIVWETHSSNQGVAWILWGDQSTVSSRRWSGTAWAATSVLSGSDDTSFVRLKADPVSGAVWTGNYQNRSSAGNARDLTERRLTGGGSSWSSKNQLWSGPTVNDPVYFRIDIATP